MHKRTFDTFKRALSGYTGGTAIIAADFNKFFAFSDYSPAITTRLGTSGNFYLIEKMKENDTQSQSRADVLADLIGAGTGEPFIAASRGRGENNEQHLEPRKDGVTNTVTTVEKDNLVVVGVSTHPFSHKLEYRGVKSINGEWAPCLRATDYKCPGTVHCTDGYRYRIRKLTERECFRLMGVDDADSAKIASAGVSKTQQYKMAGNSIVVDVLHAIFDELL